MDGTVLSRVEMDYGDLKDIGRVVIEMDGNWDVRITVDGFRFESNNTCRTHGRG